MRFALLCDDPFAAPIVDALNAAGNEHQLTHVVSATPRSDALLHGKQGIKFVAHWEDLLVAKEIDAVVVGGSDQIILDGVKQLATGGIPILFVPQAAQGSTFVYELSLIRDDNHVTLYPALWHRFDAAVIQLRSALTEGRLGRIQFLQLNRTLHQDSTATPIPQLIVDAELLPDVDLLRFLAGDYEQVTGLRTAATDQGVLMQSVVLAGRSLPEANWSISPVDGPAEWRLTVRGEKGVAIMRREPTRRSWRLELDGQRTEGNEAGTANALLGAFAVTTQLAASQTSDSGSRGAPALRKPPSTQTSQHVGNEWGELVKCFETVDATHRSVKRRRTIELHFEPMSERAIFKTQMTAMGCVLLMATFFLSLCYLGVASLIPPSNQITDSRLAGYTQGDIKGQGDPEVGKSPLPWAHRILFVLRFLVFAPLGIFLIAQLLLPLTRPSAQTAVADRNTESAQ